MNIQEREQLSQFLQQLTQVQAAQKDVEADTLIREACIRQPDAAYLLVQRAMLLDHALQNSQAQITRLQGELDQVRGNNNGCFLNANAWGNSALSRPNPPPQTLPSPATQAPAFASPPAPSAPQATSAWGSGMLGTIATTAAGVVAGGFLFQGIEHLLGNHEAHSSLMNGLSSNLTPDYQERTAINSPVDDSESYAGVLDTSSVDDFIANDLDNSV
jgi:hypothetical protein